MRIHVDMARDMDIMRSLNDEDLRMLERLVITKLRICQIREDTWGERYYYETWQDLLAVKGMRILEKQTV